MADVAPAAALLMNGVNPFCYVFDRMALLEPVSVFWWVVGLWVAGRAAAGGWWRAVVTGLDGFVALVWTKTTASRAGGLNPILPVRTLGERAGEAVGATDGDSDHDRGGGVVCILFRVGALPHYLHDFKFVFAMILTTARSHLTILAPGGGGRCW